MIHGTWLLSSFSWSINRSWSRVYAPWSILRLPHERAADVSCTARQCEFVRITEKEPMPETLLIETMLTRKTYSMRYNPRFRCIEHNNWALSTYDIKHNNELGHVNAFQALPFYAWWSALSSPRSRSTPSDSCMPRRSSIHLPSSATWYLKPSPGVSVGQSHSRGFPPKTEMIFRLTPIFFCKG